MLAVISEAGNSIVSHLGIGRRASMCEVRRAISQARQLALQPLHLRLCLCGALRRQPCLLAGVLLRRAVHARRECPSGCRPKAGPSHASMHRSRSLVVHSARASGTSAVQDRGSSKLVSRLQGDRYARMQYSPRPTSWMRVRASSSSAVDARICASSGAPAATAPPPAPALTFAPPPSRSCSTQRSAAASAFAAASCCRSAATCKRRVWFACRPVSRPPCASPGQFIHSAAQEGRWSVPTELPSGWGPRWRALRSGSDGMPRRPFHRRLSPGRRRGPG